MDLFDHIKEWLKRDGYDGLYNEENECAYNLEELFLCREYFGLLCKPGVIAGDPSGEFDYLIVPKDKE